MMIEGLRYAVLIALVAALTWIGTGVFFDTPSYAVSALPDASLCLHSRAP